MRVALRRNRATRRRVRDWTRLARESEGNELATPKRENVTPKGDLSRYRTITLPDRDQAAAEGLLRGTVTAMRGLYVEVDQGGRIWSCTVRRILRTRLIKERHPVIVGDLVYFRPHRSADRITAEGVISVVEPRRGQLQRRVGRRTQTIVANVDQAIIVTSANDPPPKLNLIDRYSVSALAGNITPIICMNKIDLDPDGKVQALLERYAKLSWTVLRVSAKTGEAIDTLREVLKGKASVVAGQSGVGKSSLLNAVQPGLQLKTGEIIKETRRGRHTTTTARLIRLASPPGQEGKGGYVVDTPGIRTFDLGIVPRHELELYFAEFLPHIPNCKFPDCTHIHESHCAVKEAVEGDEIHLQRYESYVRLFEERA